jgi:ATP-dependent helicase/nuclease subunit A
MSSTGRPPKDQAIRDRIVSDFDRSLLVEAGAGSGKTYSLAMRMAAGVQRGRYQVGEMAAVTFTRKAAAELRGGFQAAIEERLRSHPGEVERLRLETALAGLERLFAGTIHAFCAHLLRERPVDARVAPGFDELDDVADLRLRTQAWRDCVAEMRADGSKPLLDLLEAGVKVTDLENAFATVCQHEDVEFDRGSGEQPDPAPVWKRVDVFWAALRALRPPEFPPDTTCAVQRRFDEFDARLALTRARRDRLASLADFFRAWGKPQVVQYHWGGADRSDNARGKQVKELVDRFQAEVIGPFMAGYQAYVHRLAMSVLTEARASYATLRRRRNAVNYVDLLGVTARMLREHREVRRALQAKYRWLFVDEFQDTDPIQAEIFLMLAGDEPAADGAPGQSACDPFALPLRPGALFVVGDPKQSIFRFRRADIDIYNRVARRLMETGGERLSLTANFRSLPGVCALANTVFPSMFDTMTAPYSPRFEPLDPVREEEPVNRAPCIARLTVDAKNTAARAEAEAAAIAAYIRSEVASGRRTYGEFLVITPFRPRLSAYVQALDALDVPVEVSGAGFFCQSPHVRALALLLAALADPLDSVSIVGVLRGPLFGLSDPELFQFYQGGGRFELHAPLPDSDVGDGAKALQEKLGPALAAMRRLHEMVRLTRSLPMGAAVGRILEETGWLALSSTRPGGAEAGHLLQAVDRVRQVSEEGGGLVEAAHALNEEESSNQSEALPLELGRRDVVRLMNLHKAKGLEAAVVILADGGSGFKFPVLLQVVRTGDRAVGYLRVARKGEHGDVVIGQPVAWEGHEAEEVKYVAAERLRLLYVAGTRAKDLLIVCRAGKRNDNKAWAEFEDFLAAAPEIAVPEATAAELKRALSETAWADARAKRQFVLERSVVPSWDVTSVTAGAREPSKSPGPGGDSSGLPPGERRLDAGPAWGALIHGLLEHAGRHPDAQRADFERLARWLTVESPDLRPFIPEALAVVERVAGQPFWAEALEGGAMHVETPFAVCLQPGASLGRVGGFARPTVVHGVIDLVFKAGDGWRIVDYKTDVASSPDQLVHHAPQLAAYRAAWERITAEPVAGVFVLGVRS